MKENENESLLNLSLKTFLKALSAIVGLLVGLFLILTLVGVFSAGSTLDNHLVTVNSEEILPNADGERKVLGKDAPVILQINFDGVIGLDNLRSKDIRQLLVESREGKYKNGRVKALLLNMNTPGGAATDSEEIFSLILDYKAKYQVPVYAYVGGLCASGGVYIAVAADKIIAGKSSIIGSVGVIAPTFMNFTKALDKIGVDTLTISAGKSKDALNPLRPWKEGEDDNYKLIIQYLYDDFVTDVIANRPQMTREKLVEQYGAKVFPAPLAKEYGYIDESGKSLSEALKELALAANLDEAEYQVIKLENNQWWRSLFKNQASALLRGEIKHTISLNGEFDLLLQNRPLFLYCPGN